MTVAEAEDALNLALEYYTPHYTSGTRLKAREVTEAVRRLIRAVVKEEMLAISNEPT